MRLTGQERQQFREALCDAFPRRADLVRLISEGFGENLEEFSAPGNLRDTAQDILDYFSSRDQMDYLAQAALAQNRSNKKILSIAQYWSVIPAIVTPDGSLEKVLNPSNQFFHPDEWYEKMAQVAGQVCQIEVKTASGASSSGTGFLVGPDLVLTNYHVVDNVIHAEHFRAAGEDAYPENVNVRFDYRKFPNSYIREGVGYRLAQAGWLVDASPYRKDDFLHPRQAPLAVEAGLDFALLRLEKPAGNEQVIPTKEGQDGIQRGWITLNPRVTEGFPGMGWIVLQHPKGHELQAVIESNAVIWVDSNAKRIRHRANTDNGSSGAPCFNFQWDLVAIHQSGNKQLGYNLAIPIQAILQKWGPNFLPAA